MEKISIKETNFSYIMFFLGYVVFSIALVLVLPEDAPNWLMDILGEVTFLAPLIIFWIIKKFNPFKALRFGKINVADVILAYLAAYCLLPMIFLLNYITSFFAQNYVDDMMMEVFDYPFILQIFLMALMPAMVEEFIFRGFYYGSYRRCSVIKGAMMAGLLFGIAHLNINQFAYAFVIGCIFCILYEVTGNILVSMITHFAINAHTVIMMYFTEGLDVDSAQQELEMIEDASVSSIGMEVIIIGVLISFAVVGMGLFLLILNKLAKRHGKNSFVDALTNHENKESVVEFVDEEADFYENDGIQGTNKTKEKIWDFGMIMFVVVIFMYMILMEI